MTRVSLERETPRVTRETLKPTVMQCTELSTRSAVLWPRQSNQVDGGSAVPPTRTPRPRPPSPRPGPGGSDRDEPTTALSIKQQSPERLAPWLHAWPCVPLLRETNQKTKTNETYTTHSPLWRSCSFEPLHMCQNTRRPWSPTLSVPSSLTPIPPIPEPW